MNPAERGIIKQIFLCKFQNPVPAVKTFILRCHVMMRVNIQKLNLIAVRMRFDKIVSMNMTVRNHDGDAAVLVQKQRDELFIFTLEQLHFMESIAIRSIMTSPCDFRNRCRKVYTVRITTAHCFT